MGKSKREAEFHSGQRDKIEIESSNGSIYEWESSKKSSHKPEFSERRNSNQEISNHVSELLDKTEISTDLVAIVKELGRSSIEIVDSKTSKLNPQSWTVLERKFTKTFLKVTKSNNPNKNILVWQTGRVITLFVFLLLIDVAAGYGWYRLIESASNKNNDQDKVLDKNDSQDELYFANLVYALFKSESQGKSFTYSNLPDAYRQEFVKLFYQWLDNVSEAEFWETMAIYCETSLTTVEGSEDYPSLADLIYYCNAITDIASKSDDELWQWEQDQDLIDMINTLVKSYTDAGKESAAVLFRQVSQLSYNGQSLPRSVASELLVYALLEIIEEYLPKEET